MKDLVLGRTRHELVATVHEWYQVGNREDKTWIAVIFIVISGAPSQICQLRAQWVSSY